MNTERIIVTTTSEPTEWEKWLDAHAPRFLLFARSQTRNEMDAQDVLQEALLSCWRQAEESVPPAHWVFGAIRRKAIDRAREMDRRRQREEQTASDMDWFEPDIQERETGRILQSAVRELTETLREVLILKIWGGLTFREIAEALNIPPNTAASRYRYALEEMKKSLKKGALL